MTSQFPLHTKPLIFRPGLLPLLSLFTTALYLGVTLTGAWLSLLCWATWFNYIDHQHPQWQTAGFLTTFLLITITTYLSSLLFLESLSHTLRVVMITPSWRRVSLVSKTFCRAREIFRVSAHILTLGLWVWAAHKFRTLPDVDMRGDHLKESYEVALERPVYFAVFATLLVIVEEGWVWWAERMDGSTRVGAVEDIEQDIFPPYRDEEE